MTFSPSWHTTHSNKQKSNVSLKDVTLDKFDSIVSNVALSNQDREAAAIEKADSYSFQVANPWFKRTEANIKIVNKWLGGKGIRHATYPELAEAVEELAAAGLVSVDDGAYASHLDGNDTKAFKGALTGTLYDSLESMIAQERVAAIRKVPEPTPEEIAFDNLPHEEALAALRNAESFQQTRADVVINQQNGDSWITLHPEYRDDDRNGKLLLAKMRQNQQGTVARPFTIEDYEIANRQLVASGLLRQNPEQLKKIAAQEVVARAERAVNTPGSVFDNTSEDAMYELPLDEIRRRASGNFSGRDSF